MTRQEMAQRLRIMARNAWGDDLERATMQFSGMPEDALDLQWGSSGQTCRQIWDDYKRRREEDMAIGYLLDEVLQQQGL